MIIYFSENPEATIREQQNNLLTKNDLDHAFAIHFNFVQYYLAEPREIELLALVYLTKNNSDILNIPSVIKNAETTSIV